jgi:hypothetical protein
MERTSKSSPHWRGARPHMLVLTPRVRHKASFRLRHKTKTKCASQSQFFPAPTASLLSLFLSFHTSRLALSDNAYRHKAAGATMRWPYAVPFPLLLVFPLSFTHSLFNLHHQNSQGRPTLQPRPSSQRVARMCLRQPSGSSRPIFILGSIKICPSRTILNDSVVQSLSHICIQELRLLSTMYATSCS